MGDVGLKAKYERLLDEVRYLQSFLPRDVGLPARIRNASVWKSDLVGFTAITQDKLNQGELATDTWVNRIGSQIYGAFDILEQNDGAIQYYEGDAGIAVFEDPMLAILGAAAVKKAIKKLPEEELASREQVNLNLRQGIATGKIFTATIGEHRRIPVICGQALEDAYHLEGQADPEGIVRVHRNTYELTKEIFDFKPDNDAYELASEPLFTIERKETRKLQPDYETEIQRLELRKTELLSYFPQITRDELQGKRTGKVEHATILFGELPTLASLIRTHQEDADKLEEAYDAHFKVLKDVVEDEFGGEIDKMYRAVFMARFRRDVDHEEEDTRVRLKYREAAKKAALKLTERLVRDEHVGELLGEAGLRNFSTRVEHERPNQGLSRGKVYIGPIGSEKRKAFTMLGSIVNKAARQMKDVHDNPEAYAAVDGIATDDSEGATLVRTVKLKGIGETHIYGPDKSLTRVIRKKTLVGRDAEIAQIASLVQTAHSGEKKLVNIVADAGYGKTELTREMERQFRERGGKVYRASAVEQARDIPDYLFQDFARNALKIRPGDAEADVKKSLEKITDTESRKVIHHWLGLNIKGYEKPTASSKEELEKARRQALLQLIQTEKPKLLIFNDIHWADENSLGTLEWLSKELGSQTLIATNYRPKEISREFLWQRIELGALNEQGTAQLVYHLTNNKPDAKLAKFVFEHSHGSPLYIEEIVHYLKDDGLIMDGRLTKEIEAIEIPGSIEKLILQRYRNLRDATKQEVLDYSACMFGEEFPKKLLEKALGKEEGELDNILAALQRADFLKLNNGTISFKHNLTKNAVHDYAIRPTDRVKRHTRIGDTRKELYGEGADQLDALAFDYGNGDDTEKLIKYNFLAGQRWVNAGYNDTGLRYLDTVEVIPESKLKSPQSKAYYVQMLGAKGIVSQKSHRIEKAKAYYEKAFSLVQTIESTELHEIMFKLHLNRGALRRDILGDIEGAISDYTEARDFARKLRNLRYEGAALSNLSICLKDEARLKTGLEAIEVLERLGNTASLAFAYNNIISPLRESKDFEKAKKAGTRAFEIACAIGNLEVQVRSIVSLALVSNDEGDSDLTEQKFREALRLMSQKEKENTDLVSIIYDSWTEVCLQNKKIDLGLELCEKWLSLPLTLDKTQKVQKRKEEFLRLRSSS